MRTAKLIAIAFLSFVALVLAVCFVFLRSGVLSARTKPGAFEYALANHALTVSIPAGTKNAKNPVSATPQVMSDANKSFSENCAVCHANNGSGRTDTAKGLSPEVPDLRAAHVQSLTDGEMFYIIKNGVRFTGMPGWDLPDKQIWALVRLIRQFPNRRTSSYTSRKPANNAEQLAGFVPANPIIDVYRLFVSQHLHRL